MELEQLRELLVELQEMISEGKAEAIDEVFASRGLDVEDVVGQLGFEVSSAAFLTQQRTKTMPVIALSGMFALGVMFGLRVADERAVLELKAQLEGDA